MKTKIISLTTVLLQFIAVYGPCGFAAESPAALQQKQGRSIDPALAASVVATMQGLRDKTIFLVDVRRPELFEQYHIPGSLNIALHALKAKPFLKTRPIVLMNEGFLVGPLARTCKALNAKGFKARIMAGGLVAWAAKGGKIQGDPFALTGVNRLLPQVFFQEQGHDHHLLIYASDSPADQAVQILPKVMHMAGLETKKGIARLKKMIRQRADDPFSIPVIFTASDKENDLIQRKLADAGIKNVFFLQGGLPALEKHLEYLALARRPKEKRRISTGGCPSCAAQRQP